MRNIDPVESRPSDSDIDNDHTVDAGPLKVGGNGPHAIVMLTEFDVRFAFNLTADKPDDCGGENRHVSL